MSICALVGIAACPVKHSTDLIFALTRIGAYGGPDGGEDDGFEDLHHGLWVRCWGLIHAGAIQWHKYSFLIDLLRSRRKPSMQKSLDAKRIQLERKDELVHRTCCSLKRHYYLDQLLRTAFPLEYLPMCSEALQIIHTCWLKTI